MQLMKSVEKRNYLQTGNMSLFTLAGRFSALLQNVMYVTFGRTPHSSEVLIAWEQLQIAGILGPRGQVLSLNEASGALAQLFPEALTKLGRQITGSTPLTKVGQVPVADPVVAIFMYSGKQVEHSAVGWLSRISAKSTQVEYGFLFDPWGSERSTEYYNLSVSIMSDPPSPLLLEVERWEG